MSTKQSLSLQAACVMQQSRTVKDRESIMRSKEAGTPSMATCAAVTMLLPTLSSVL